jgi:uncharacterized protein YjiS (DUF1127 family)
MFTKITIALPAAIAMGAAVSTMDPRRPTSRLYRFSRWSQVKRHFAEWHLRASLRHELRNLSDRMLRDVGVSRFDVEFEAYKPFWMA